MDRELFIKILTEILEHQTANGQHVIWLTDENVRKILELLKEQEDVEPIVIVDTWVCGNCKTKLERQALIAPDVVMDENFNYCPCCGKKVRWSV